MKLLRSLDEMTDAYRGGALSIGNFDGVHLGHVRLIERLVAMSQRLGGPAVVFTFDPHPAQLLYPDHAPTPLAWIERNADLLGQLGVDAVLAFPTDLDFLVMESDKLFGKVVRETFDARGMVEGPNFFFGFRRSGDTQLLAQYSKAEGRQLDVVEPLMVEGTIVSSSRVRALVSSGSIDEAVQLVTA